MKTAKKTLSVILVLVMVLALSVGAFAAKTDDGSITVENATKGATYQAYKIFEAVPNADNSRVIYKVDASNTALLNALKAEGSPFEVSEVATDGKYSVDTDADITAISAWIQANLGLFTPVEGVYQPDGTVLFDKLPYGYYYVTSSLGAVVSVDTNTPNVEIKDKNNTKPGNPEKTVSEADVAIGDLQTYTIKFEAQNWVTTGEGKDVQSKQITEFTIKDTYTNLRINDESKIVVKVNGNVVTPASVTVNNKDDATGGTLEIKIKWADESGNSLYAYEGDNKFIPVEVTYEAEVTSAAVNTAKNSVEIGNDGTDEVLTAGTESKTYNLTLNKVDENGDALAGAKFTLTNKETGEQVKVVKVAKGDSQTLAAADATEWDYRVADSKDSGAVTELVTDADGSFVVYGLDKATYTVTETEAPVGYNKAAAQDVDVDDGAEIKIVNQLGAELPSTGSVGTTIFYILGSILVIGAGVVLVSKRRMAE